MKIHTILPALFLGLLLARPAFADGDGLPAAGSAESKMTAPAATTDDGTIRLSPDKTKIIELTTDAGSVIVNNPAKAIVRMDNPRLAVVMAREPGTTSFTILDKNGKVIIERTVIITAAKKNYVRIRRICQDSGNNGDCAASAYYYCPDGCYEVTPLPNNEAAGDVPEVQSGNAGAGGVPESYDENLSADKKDLYRELDSLKARGASPEEYLQVLERAKKNGVIQSTDDVPPPQKEPQ